MKPPTSNVTSHRSFRNECSKASEQLLLQDQRYQYEDPFVLKTLSNRIKLWTVAIDVRSPDPVQELPLRRLGPDDVVLFHYTNEEAMQARRNTYFKGITSLALSHYIYFRLIAPVSGFPSFYKLRTSAPLQGFMKITSPKSNLVRASMLIESDSNFGHGAYTSSKAPHEWSSQDEVLLNNFFPSKQVWMNRTNPEDHCNWPGPDLLRSEQSNLTPHQVKTLLGTKFGKELVHRWAGKSCYCIPLVCNRHCAKDRKWQCHTWVETQQYRLVNHQLQT